MGRSRWCILIQAWILMRKEYYNTQTKFLCSVVTQREERLEEIEGGSHYRGFSRKMDSFDTS